MTATNRERAAFRASGRIHTFQFPPPLPERPSWMEPQEDSGLVRLVVVGLAIALGVGLMLAFWARVAEDVRHEQWAKAAIEECKASGQEAHVYRDSSEKVLGVRCE